MTGGGGLLAGAAKCEITPRTPCMLFGYAARSHPHEGIHDPLFVRALYVRGSDGAEILLVSADVLWFGAEAADELKRRIGYQLGIPAGHVLLAGIHTHSAPATGGDALKEKWLPVLPERLRQWLERPGAEYFNREWRHVLISQTLAACAIAKLAARPASLRSGRGRCMIGVNRRERKPDGRIVLGRNPDGPCDREVIGIAVDGVEGRPIARVANFACHGVVMGQTSYQVSGDWCGIAARQLEETSGEVPFLFLQGGSGNVNPRVGPAMNFDHAGELAGEFATAFQDLAWNDVPAADGRVGGGETVLSLPLRNGAGSKPVRVPGLNLGPIRLTGFPGEVFSETAIGVKAARPGQPVLVCSYLNAGDDGYLPVADVYPEGGYEVETSPYAPEAEAIVRQALIGMTA